VAVDPDHLNAAIAAANTNGVCCSPCQRQQLLLVLVLLLLLGIS
jgi:hypothetical protein